MFGPIASIEAFVFRAFNFSGRATRAEYWWVFLARVFLFLFTIISDLISIAMTETVSLNPLAYTTVWAVLLTVIPATALLVRRLHDTGRGAGWILVALVPTIGPFWLMGVCMAKSEPEENQWGPVRSPFGFSKPKKSASGAPVHDPMMGYATLLKTQREPTPEEIAAQRQQISEYYRTKVLGARPVSG